MDLSKPKKKKKKDKEMDPEIQLLKEVSAHVQEKINLVTTKMLKKFSDRFDYFFEKYERKMLKEFEKSSKLMESYCNKLDSIEETFLILYHNIKQNQFLYANYPNDWLEETTLQIKKKLSCQNFDLQKTVNEEKIQHG